MPISFLISTVTAVILYLGACAMGGSDQVQISQNTMVSVQTCKLLCFDNLLNGLALITFLLPKLVLLVLATLKQ